MRSFRLKSTAKKFMLPVARRNRKNHSRNLNVRCNANKNDGVNFRYGAFAEKLNGRCAMQGFMWGSANEILNHDTVLQQVVANSHSGMSLDPQGVLALSTVVGLVTLGTVFTSVVKDASSYKDNIFTSDAEVLNGRTAMVGFILLSIFHIPSLYS